MINVGAWKGAVMEFVRYWNERLARPFRWTFQGYPLQTGRDLKEVQARAGHLLVESREGEDTRTIARLTPLAGGLHGLSFCKHTGGWEPMPLPFMGPVEKVADDLLAALAPYLQRMDF